MFTASLSTTIMTSVSSINANHYKLFLTQGAICNIEG